MRTHLKLINLIASAKTPFPNRDTFTGTRSQDLDIFLGRGTQFNPLHQACTKYMSVTNTLFHFVPHLLPPCANLFKPRTSEPLLLPETGLPWCQFWPMLDLPCSSWDVRVWRVKRQKAFYSNKYNKMSTRSSPKVTRSLCRMHQDVPDAEPGT